MADKGLTAFPDPEISAQFILPMDLIDYFPTGFLESVFLDLDDLGLDKTVQICKERPQPERVIVIGTTLDKSFREAQGVRRRITSQGALFHEKQAGQTFEEARASILTDSREILCEVPDWGASAPPLLDRPSAAAISLYGNPPHPMAGEDLKELSEQTGMRGSSWRKRD